MFKRILLIMSLAVTSHAYGGDASSVFDKINDRLSYMGDVALYKINNDLVIEDKAREVIVINKAAASAGDHGLSPEKTKAFFRAQIQVAKAIQYRHIADWQSAPTNRIPLDLTTEVRPELIKLGNEINSKIAEYIAENGKFKSSQFDHFKRSITVKYISDDDKAALFNALMEINVKQ